jgi:hypothetical protein
MSADGLSNNVPSFADSVRLRERRARRARRARRRARARRAGC